MKTIYVVYLTIYGGQALPPFYIGSTSLAKFNRGYKGSVSSLEFKTLWKHALKTEEHQFDTIVVSEHDTRKAALDAERTLQERLDVVPNPLFINKAIAGVYPKNSGKGRPMSEKTRAAILKSRIGSVHSEETKQKMSVARRKRPPASAESRAKMSASQKNRPPINEETRAKLSEAAKKATQKRLATKARNQLT